MSTAALGVAISGLAITAALAGASWAVHDANEDRLLEQRTAEAAAVLGASIPALEISIAATAGVPEVVEDADRQAFDQSMGDDVGEGNRFVSASVWSLEEGTPVTVIGVEPRLTGEPDDVVSSFLDRAAASEVLSVFPLLDGDAPRLGYAMGSGGPAAHVVYAEQELPADRTAVEQSGRAFAGLDYALYLGDAEEAGRLVFSSTASLPLDGRRASETIPFGDTVLLLTMSPTTHLAGGLPAALPWAIVAGGTALTAGAAALTDNAVRRRRRAEALAVENERLYAEQRAIAETLQHSLLPRRLPDLPGLEIAVRYVAGVSGTEVGGDWYDVLPVGDGVVVVIGDVSGRGVEAASAMAAVRHSVRTLAARGDTPQEVLTAVSRMDVPESPGHFATVLVARIDVGARSAVFVSAGHLPALLVADGGATFVEPPVGPPIGLKGGADYGSTTVDLPPAGMLLFITDGLVERRAESIDDGLERLRTTAVDRDGSLDDVLGKIVDSLHQEGSADDAAALALRWGPPASDG